MSEQELRQELQAARASEERFRRIFDLAREGIWMVGPDERVVYMNGHMAEMLGYGAGEGLGRSIYDFMSDEERETSRRIRAEGTIGKAGPREALLRRKDGSHVWTLSSTSPMIGPDGSFEGVLGVVMDISERKRSDEELRRANDINQSIIDTALDVVCVNDAEGRFVSVGRRCKAVWGYEPEELIGTRFIDLVHPDDREATLASTSNLLGGRRPPAHENRYIRKDGTVVPMLFTCIWSDEHQLLFAFGRDLTRQKEMEARLSQSQRLEAVGQLTGGIAHDFNNLLTVIMGNAEELAERLQTDPGLRLLAEMTRTAAERGADLTNRLLAFARRQPLEPKVIDVNGLVRRMEALLRRTLAENVEIEMVRGAGLWSAFVDPSQCEAAILNLAVNARDAMPGGGRLTIETANAYIDETYAGRHLEVAPGQYVMLSVSDSGTGMTPEVVARAFEPFYTTKEIGKGSGLGLSMVYGFVKQSHGHVKIYSEPDHGTTVKIYLPRGDGAEDKADLLRIEAEPRGSETILIVEDDELVRTYVEGQLVSLGYNVVPAVNGVGALEIIRARDDIDLLFTDVVMPGGLNGPQLAAEAKKVRPGLRVLFTSGYTENAIVHHGRLDRGVHLLSKPYRRAELAAKVRFVLSAG
ncbi:MAG TPA: PAS domain S-box protein [Parvibaculum sp.]